MVDIIMNMTEMSQGIATACVCNYEKVCNAFNDKALTFSKIGIVVAFMWMAYILTLKKNYETNYKITIAMGVILGLITIITSITIAININQALGG